MAAQGDRPIQKAIKIIPRTKIELARVMKEERKRAQEAFESTKGVTFGRAKAKPPKGAGL